MHDVGQSLQLATLDLPDGLDDWLAEFVGEVRRDTATLVENGAHEAATAREAVIRTFVRIAAARFDETVTVAEAARVIGRDKETVRRMVRKGSLTDTREKPRGHIRVKRGELEKVARRRAKKYDPVADAQDVTKLRRTAA